MKKVYLLLQHRTAGGGIFFPLVSSYYISNRFFVFRICNGVFVFKMMHLVLLLWHRTRGRGSFSHQSLLTNAMQPKCGQGRKRVMSLSSNKYFRFFFCCKMFCIRLNRCILLARNKTKTRIKEPRSLEYSSRFVYPCEYSKIQFVVCAGSNANLCKVMQSGVQYFLHHSTVEDFTIQEFT